MANSRILRCFLGADLRLGHPGLAKIALKKNIDVNSLGAGEFVLFINHKRDKMKLYGGSQCLTYYRPTHGGVNMDALQHIPAIFGATGKFDYTAAVQKSVESALVRKGRQS